MTKPQCAGGEGKRGRPAAVCGDGPGSLLPFSTWILTDFGFTTRIQVFSPMQLVNRARSGLWNVDGCQRILLMHLRESNSRS